MRILRQKIFFKMPAGLTQEAENSIRSARKDAAEKLLDYRYAKMYDKATGSNSSRWMYQTPEQIKSTLNYEVKAATKKSVRQRAKNIAKIRAQKQPSVFKKLGEKLSKISLPKPSFPSNLRPAMIPVRVVR